MRRAARVVGVVAMAAVAASPAAAQERGGPVFIDILDGEPARALAEADAAVRAARYDTAAQLFQTLLEASRDAARDRLVVIDDPARDTVSADGGPRYASLAVAVRKRLAALPREGLRAYRRSVDARAGSLAEEVLEPGALAAEQVSERAAEFLSRYLFSSQGALVATAAGDRALEAGDLLSALSMYELASLVPDAPAEVATRLEAARGALAALDRTSAAIAHPRAYPEIASQPSSPAAAPASPSARALLEGERVEVSLLTRDEPGEVNAGCELVPALTATAVVRPGRVLVVSPKRGGESVIRTIPALGTPMPAAGDEPFLLGGASTGDVLALALEHSRFLDGAEGGFVSGERDEDPSPLAVAGGRAPRGSRPGRPFEAWIAQRLGRGALNGPAFDLYVFDLRHGMKLLLTTAEAAAFGAEGPWTQSVEWTAIPALGPGLVFSAAANRSGEPEVSAAAFEPGPPPRLLWRTFICAREFTSPDERARAAPLEPAITRVGSRVLVDSGIGVLAALDARRGEVLWLARRGAPRDDGREVHTVVRDEPEAPPADWPTFAPLVVPARGSRPAFGVFASRASGDLVALEAATGRTVWSVASEGEGPLEPLCAVGGRIAVVVQGALVLVDAGTGKYCSPPLPLPGGRPQDAPRPTGRAVAIGDRLVLPLPGGLLVVRVEENGPGQARLIPELGERIDLDAHADLALLSDSLALVDGTTLRFFRQAGSRRPDPLADALAVAYVYGATVDRDLVESLKAALAGAPPRPSLGTDEASSFEVDRVGSEIRFRLGGPAQGRARVAILMSNFGRAVRAEVVDEDARARGWRSPFEGR